MSNSFMDNSQDLEALARGLAPRHGDFERADREWLRHRITRLNFAEDLIADMRRQIAKRLDEMQTEAIMLAMQAEVHKD